MSLVEDLGAQFQAINVSVSPHVLQKCAELCATYLINSEDFMDLWMAYTASYLNGAPPTLDALEKLERKELKKQAVSVKQKEVEIMDTTPVSVLEESFTVEEVTVSSGGFQTRSDACSVQLEFGECGSFKERCDNVVIRVLNEDFVNCKLLGEKRRSKREALELISRFIVAEIVRYYQLQITDEKSLQNPGELTVPGRLFSDNSTKFEFGSAQLEVLLELSNGQPTKLNVNNLAKMSLFPGQTVVVSGNNTKVGFTVKELYTGAPLAKPEAPITLSETLQIVTAAGPFTLQEDLLFEPLDSLIKYVSEFKPNLLFLMGPFLDASHPLLDTLCETFDSLFENLITKIMDRLKGTGIQVILAPSHKDVHNLTTFPSFPYKLHKHNENLHLVPDPFLIDINGVVIGGTSADILFHLSKVEDSRGATGPRMERLISHIFNQRNFYPLYPPNSDITVDYRFIERFGMLETAPDVMFLPSTFRHFVKVYEDCVVVNPERLIKGNGAGTFARLEIRGKGAQRPLSDKISCKIYRV